MGKRGPRKKPAAIHKKRGTYKRCRHAEPDLPPAEGLPAAPVELSGRAARHWRAIGSKLLAAGLLTELDGVALWLLAEAIADYIQANEEVAAGSLTVMGEKGNEYQAPAVAIRSKAWARVIKLLQEFGMTPSARTGLNVDAKPPEDKAVSRILGFKVIG